MAYSIEGGGSTTYSKSKAWLYAHSSDAHRFLQLITDVTVDYLVGQVLAGAQVRSTTPTTSWVSHAHHMGITCILHGNHMHNT